jgi:agmatinase
MIPLHGKLPPTFLAIPDKGFQKAAAAVLPVPYYGTGTWTTWGIKPANGPAAIIKASQNLETFDEELDTDPSHKGICTLPAVKPAKKPEQVAAQVEKEVGRILGAGKFPLALGGEHCITPGAVKAAASKFPNLTVLQFDAHADLRNEMEGTKWSHACAARRSLEHCAKVVQVGVRSLSEEDAWFIEKNPSRVATFFDKDSAEWGAAEILAECTQDVYISFDLDAFNPAVMPATRTPEPGGLDWKTAIGIIREVAKAKRVVGADVVELSPIKGLVAPDLLAAKLAYKLLSYSLARG